MFMLATILLFLLVPTESPGARFFLGDNGSGRHRRASGMSYPRPCRAFSGAKLARAKELRLVLFYTGAAWGAGAFLALPANLGTLPVILFIALPCVSLAFFLPDTAGFTLFLAPAGLMTIGAALARAFPHAELDMSLILILQWGLFSGAFLRNREPHPALRQG